MLQKLNLTNFRGPWAGLPVPWDERDRFDEATYRADVARCGQAGAPGIYTGGTTGEFYAMEFDEFKAVTTAAVEAGHQVGKPVMIGCTSTYTLGAVRRAAFAAAAGADAIQLALPFWMEVPDDQVVPFYREVAAAAPGLALSVYETARQKKTLSVEQHYRIKEAVPDYLMVKATGAAETTERCRELSKIINVFVGEDQFAAYGRIGAAGGCSSLVYWFPQYIVRLWQKVEAKDWPGAEEDCAVLSQVFKQLDVLFPNRGFMDSAYDRLGGRIIPFLSTNLRCRGPYPHATEEDVARLREWCLKSHPELLRF